MQTVESHLLSANEESYVLLSGQILSDKLLFLGFTMYTTCVIWLAFVPLYFGTANHVALRITSMAVTISLSASVTVACLFSPKLYIILIRPERNIRQSMMPMRYSAINKSSTNTGSGSMMAAVMVTAATCDQKQNVQKHVSPIEPVVDDIFYKQAKTKDTSTQTSPNTEKRFVPAPDAAPKINNNYNIGNGPANISQEAAKLKELTS
ncbi:unnamed protein product [Diabrotica balteata]|uniref:G-protein coupled receptors family 3 profile domain-containing protein n=1 Tax=Diabrotica balteata TaxID=107213 RepID=A0A9N9TC47_DIABA|nr:unnamed protein product [Diabrotica balteata]